ncbi:helix-turn-helix domain-containing protein [Streptomyces griseoloalbus]|uniref:Uncharacterized protein n=1 Tax=Streptomyces griseoloalbus TaxID=67303 RepID=A0A7W8BS67_9ACTN|nr:helix-turn-helix domain-containing protein [Streptomyces albaduncus]MBB5128460.1 hypothetical protein [Streptomyces albaduncus]GGW68051.1 hypothetical protein GCM10010340_52720 [Streptomyces albaduncus]
MNDQQQPRDIEGILDRAHLTSNRTAADRLAADMAALLTQYERETVARRALAGDPNPSDADPLDYVRTIADNYTRHRDLPDAESMYLELAAELTLDDARVIRLAAEAVAKATPRLIYLAAEEDGKTAAAIADELGVTESYVYRVLREQRAAESQPDGTKPWDAFWTIERWEDGRWHEFAAQSSRRMDTPATLAEYLLNREQEYAAEGARLRVRVWQFGTSETHPPLAEATTAQ